MWIDLLFRAVMQLFDIQRNGYFPSATMTALWQLIDLDQLMWALFNHRYPVPLSSGGLHPIPNPFISLFSRSNQVSASSLFLGLSKSRMCPETLSLTPELSNFHPFVLFTYLLISLWKVFPPLHPSIAHATVRHGLTI